MRNTDFNDAVFAISQKHFGLYNGYQAHAPFIEELKEFLVSNGVAELEDNGMGIRVKTAAQGVGIKEKAATEALPEMPKSRKETIIADAERNQTGATAAAAENNGVEDLSSDDREDEKVDEPDADDDK